MDSRDGREGRELLCELRIEFHRARAERVEARVDPEIHLREPRVVSHDLVFGEVRNSETVPTEPRRHQVREVDRLVRRGSLLQEERLVPIGLPEAHATASRARSRRFTSSAFWRSVVANSAASLSSGSCRASGMPPWTPRVRRPRWTAE